MIANASQIRKKITNNPYNKSENDEINSVLSKIDFCWSYNQRSRRKWILFKIKWTNKPFFHGLFC